MYKLRDVLVITEEQYMSIRGEIEAQRRYCFTPPCT